MSALFQRRGQAAEFARLVDGTNGVDDDAAARHASLLATVSLMREQPVPEPRADFVADLRSQLMLQADTLLVAAAVPARVPTLDAREERLRLRSATSSPTSRRHRRERRLGALAAAFVIVGSATGVSFAAQGSLPGETLYSVKRGVEAVALKLQPDDAGRGTEQLHLSATRLDEVAGLMGESPSTERDRLVAATLKDYSASANDGADLLLGAYRADARGAHVAAVRTFAATQMAQLGSVASLASTTRDAFAGAADTLAGLDQEARSVCGACSSAGVVSVPGTLAGLTPAASLSGMLGPDTTAADSDSGSPPAAAGLAGAGAALGGTTSDLTRGASQAPGPFGISGSPATPPRTDGLSGLVDGVSGLVSGSGSGTSDQGSGGPGSSSGTAGTVGRGVGGTVDKVTGGSAGSKTGGAVGSTVDRAGDAVGNTVGQVTDGVDQLLGGLAPSAHPRH